MDNLGAKMARAAPAGVLRPALYLSLMLTVVTLCAPAVVAQPAAVTATRVGRNEISVDGKLEEPAWRTATTVKLTQQSPKPGAPTPYETEVRVLAAGDRLYFGFTCHDPEGRKIAVHTMQRDGDTEGDDKVSIVLDTYGDRRTGYYFQVNAAGARSDGLISTPESASLDWDGIWDARTQRNADGWTAEIVIPTRTLSFARGLTHWGVNFERFVPRERLTMRWSGATLDSFLYDLSRAGTVEGTGELEQGKGLEFSPYGVGRSNSFFRGQPRSWQGAVGGDVTWKITPQLVTVGTFNTDFAETEVDARQINLTRFPLFFPEKRAFFLEGSNQYDFGLGLNRGEDSEFLPFFSRRIGLLNGEEIPIDAGVKLNGRVGRWNLAMLDVETRETQTSTQFVPSTNLLASRVSYDVTDKVRVGGIFTNGDPQGIRSNQLTGVDAVYRTSTFMGNKNFLAGAWTARSTGDVGAGDPQGWGWKVDYPNDLFDCNAALTKYGDALEPDLGFLPRPGTRHGRAGCAYQPRPSKDGPLAWVRQEFFENEYEIWTDLKGNVQTWDYFMAPVNVRMESGDRFEFNYNPHHETLTAPFEIAPGVLLPPGDYTYTRFRVEAQSSKHRPVQAGTTTWFGNFYDGSLTQQTNYVGFTAPGARWDVTASMENDFARLREGAFVQRLWQVKADYAWSPNLVLSTFVQYDTVSNNVGTNTRLRWTIRPGNDLFLVWNRGWQKAIRNPHDLNLTPENEAIAVKLRWTFRR